VDEKMLKMIEHMEMFMLLLVAYLITTSHAKETRWRCTRDEFTMILLFTYFWRDGSILGVGNPAGMACLCIFLFGLLDDEWRISWERTLKIKSLWKRVLLYDIKKKSIDPWT
jgi:hypothetical protein